MPLPTLRMPATCLVLAATAMALPLLAARPAKSAPAARPWNALEARKATIGSIEVVIGDVFDLSKPEENIWIGRLADHLHASTREGVIRGILLFKEGDPVRARRIYETERLLRALAFVKDARIVPVVGADGVVVARVEVRDAWTTQVNAGFSSVGGQRSMNLGVTEKNFLGTGKSVGFAVSKDHERRTWDLSYADPQVLGSRWTAAVEDQYLSDGTVRSLKLERPFFALDTPWSATLDMGQKHTSLYLYDQSTTVYQAPFIQDEVRVAGAVALHEAGDRVWRGGLAFDRQDTHYGAIVATGTSPSPLLPPLLVDRRLRGPGVILSTQKDAFDTFYDLLGMDTPEDYNQAWNGSLTVGSYRRALGSSMNAPFFDLQANNGWSASSEDLTLLTVAAGGRLNTTGLENGQLNLALTQYRKLTSNQILAGFAAVDLGCRLDPESWYYLGGDQGLRGFPNQLRAGDARWLTSIDYRLLTDQRYWGIFRLGYSAFIDAGAIRQMDGRGWSRPYSDAGIGLRLGNLKSSLGRVVLLSVAVPLTRERDQARVQFTVGNTMRF